MKFEWDPHKAKKNLRKHGVSFEEAATAILDEFSRTGSDPDHSVSENIPDRAETIRIISARREGEREIYEEL